MGPSSTGLESVGALSADGSALGMAGGGCSGAGMAGDTGASEGFCALGISREKSEVATFRARGTKSWPHFLHWGSPEKLTKPHLGHFTAVLLASGRRPLVPFQLFQADSVRPRRKPLPRRGQLERH